jgi:hypothetical protein
MWKKIPIEWYILVPFTGLTFLVLYLLGLNVIEASGVLDGAILFLYLFGGGFFFLSIFLLYLYLAGRFTGILGNAWFAGDKELFHRLCRMLGECVLFIVPLAVAILDLGAITGAVDNVWQIKRVVAASNALAAVDYRVIGGYPMIMLGHFFARYGGEMLSITAYDILTLIMSAFLIYAILFRQALARKFLLFFFITQVIALPTAFLVPALSPYNFYTGGIPPQDQQITVAAQFSAYHPSPTLITTIAAAVKRQAAGGASYLDLTNFPSMHAAWGAGMIYFGVAAFGVAAAYFLVPWFILELAGALYTGEHYAVDLLAGIAAACIALWVADQLLKLEKRYYSGKTSFAIFAMMGEDVAEVKKFGQATYRRARKVFHL